MAGIRTLHVTLLVAVALWSSLPVHAVSDEGDALSEDAADDLASEDDTAEAGTGAETGVEVAGAKEQLLPLRPRRSQTHRRRDFLNPGNCRFFENGKCLRGQKMMSFRYRRSGGRVD